MRIEDPGWEKSDPGWKKVGSGINIPDPEHCDILYRTCGSKKNSQNRTCGSKKNSQNPSASIVDPAFQYPDADKDPGF
jgi:hypothetical protein